MAPKIFRAKEMIGFHFKLGRARDGNDPSRDALFCEEPSGVRCISILRH